MGNQEDLSASADGLKQQADRLIDQAEGIKQQAEQVQEHAEKIKEQVEEVTEDLKEEAKEAYREARPWLVFLGRFGHAAKGIVYMTLGVFIVRAILGAGSANVDQRSTFREIARQPFFGPLLLGLLAVGLAGYVLWQFVQAVVDPQEYGRGARGLIKRGAFIVTGLSYAGLVLLAVQLILGLNPSPEMEIEDWTAPLLGTSFGPWLFGMLGLGFLVYFGFMAYYALTGKFKKKLSLPEMDEQEQRWAIQAGRMGLIGRGLLLAVVGGFLIHAAIRYNPEEVGGLGDILLALARQPSGPWILGGVSLGLIAYGFYTLVLVRYGRYIT